MPELFNRCMAFAVAIGLLAVVVSASPAAAPTAAQRTEIKQAEAALRKAGNFFRAKKYRESGEAAQEAVASLEKLPPEKTEELAAPLLKQLERAKELLAAQGIVVSMPGEPVGPTVSFTGQVAPLLVAKCGGCHVQRARGDFSMANFAALAKGSASGVVIMAGDADGSRIIEVIESGDMPRGGTPLGAEEIALLKDWINGGARFDGPNPTASLASYSPSKPTDAPVAKPALVTAGEDDAVQFAADIGPVLLANCMDCHGDQNPRNNLSFSTFAQLLAGGDSGPIVVPGKPAESLLAKKLRGTASGARMPQGRGPLPDETIAKVEKWIELGAKFDGGDASLALETVVAQVAAAGLTHSELAQKRIELAEKTWRLILPDTEAHREESESVLVVGGVGAAVLSGVARVAEEQVAELRKLFKVPDDQPLIKGRLTLLVFDKRYDYGEVGTMLEHRELPSTWRGHWSYNALDPYGCILLEDDGTAAAGVVAQQIAGAYVASLGKVPRWFAEGSARAIAARLDRKDPRVQQWNDQAAQLVETLDKPEGFITASLPPEDSDVLSYSFTSRYLMAPPTRDAALVTALQEGSDFDAAFAKYYGGSPAEVVPKWLVRVARRRR